jgi:hypothetical protein
MTFTGGRQAGRGILSDSIVNAVTVRLGVEGEQQVAVHRLCRQGNAIEVLVGRAGTGKTTTVAAVADSYRIAGWDVIGVAPSARAARELTSGAGIPAHTVPRFLRHVERHPLDVRTVVVMDEAGMAGLSDLVTVLEAAASARAKVILVGDPRQLPEIGPGGGLAAAIRLLDTEVCELTLNRRQRQAWEIAALDELRHGDPVAAWDAYRQHGRVVTAELSADLHLRAVDDWWRNRRSGADSVLLAGTRAEVSALNRLARQRAADEGGLTGPVLMVGEIAFQVGDRVLCTRNHTTAGPDGVVTSVENGTVGTVIAIDHEAASLTMRIAGRADHVELDVDYLAAGHLQHGYAMTVHKAQGVTVDHVHVVGPAGLYRESAYVGLSRARCGGVLYVTAAQAVELDAASHSRGIPLAGDHTPDVDDQLLDRLRESRAKQLVTWRYPNAEAVADLARQPLSALEQRLRDIRAVERQLQLSGHTHPAPARRAHDRAVRVRPHLAVGARVRSLDWDNVGTIVDVHDHDGAATVRFIGDRGTTTRSLPWSQLHPIGATASPVLPAAADWLRTSGAQVAALERDWAEQLARHQVNPGEEALLTAAIDLRHRRLAADLTARDPTWLTHWLGRRPEDPGGANVYDEAVETIAAWRDRLAVPDQASGLGTQPADEANAARQLDAMETILRSRQWLHQRQPPTPATFTPLTEQELNQRIQSLEQLLASAPPDCSKVVTALTPHPVDADGQQALAAALAQQDARRSWILHNWPHVVEYHELQRLRAGQAAVPDRVATVSGLLDRLSSLVSQDPQREERSLFELRRSLEDAEPERQLVALTAALFRTNDRLGVVTQRLTDNACDTNCDDLLAERAMLTEERSRLRTAVAEERTMASRARKRPPHVHARRDRPPRSHPSSGRARSTTSMAHPMARRARSRRPSRSAPRPPSRQRDRSTRLLPRTLEHHQSRALRQRASGHDHTPRGVVPNGRACAQLRSLVTDPSRARSIAVLTGESTCCATDEVGSLDHQADLEDHRRNRRKEPNERQPQADGGTGRPTHILRRRGGTPPRPFPLGDLRGDRSWRDPVVALRPAHRRRTARAALSARARRATDRSSNRASDLSPTRRGLRRQIGSPWRPRRRPRAEGRRHDRPVR